MAKKNKKSWNLDKLSKWLIVIAIIFAISAFVLPYFITKFSIIDFTETGQIGDTIGGIMNPFIGIASIIVMFLAFYMQYKANEIQRDLFKEQKEQFDTELLEQRNQFERNQFDNQFFEMLKTHKENVNEISIEKIYSSYDSYAEKHIKHKQFFTGRGALEYIIEEINIAYYINKAMNENSFDPKECLNEAYSFVWNGIENAKETSFREKRTLTDYLIIYRNNVSLKGKNTVSKILYEYEYPNQLEISYSPNKVDFVPFNNHSSSLGHYYRHLYQIVRYVVQKDFLTYNEKRNYLRILRAQMSNPEQVLLFYNWLSGYGERWETATNHFLTDYRMIHNVLQKMIIEDFDLVNIFDEINPNYETEWVNGKKKDKENDPLFEFQN